MKKLLAILLSTVLLLSFATFASAEQKAPLKVAVCIAEALGDLGFNDSADAGLKKLEADFGVQGSIV